MLARWVSYISFVCFGVLTLVAMYVTRRPLCIESKVVEKMDRLGVSSTDTAYRCGLNKQVPFSSFFNEKGRDLSQRLNTIERFLENLEPFQKKIQVTIFEDRPLLFKVQDHQIFIGQEAFAQKNVLEKAVAKVWFREKSDSFFANQELFEEVITDFLVSNAMSLPTKELRSSQWPYLIKSVKSYCESAWKFPEHIAACAQPDPEQNAILKSYATEFSLRPLLSLTWIRSFQDLSIMQQGRFLKSFASLLKEDHTPSLPIIRNAGRGVSNSPLLQAAEAVRNVNSYLTTSHVLGSSVPLREFVTNLNQELTQAGFQDTFTAAHFDVIYVSETALTEKSEAYIQFKEIAELQPKLHIALKDSENVWLMPTKHPIPLRAFGQMRAAKAIVEKCGQFDFSFVLEFSNFVEKLLVVDSCDHVKKARYINYFREGIEAFAADNKEVAFVQFHIPSIAMKKDQLAGNSNIYDLVQNRESNSPVFQTLGWQEIKWSERAQAYRPKAFVDAIEWFRAPIAPSKTN